uniref:CSON006570 protein n=1 Tax=Culicoides sonorensis TaxID=179676 RepID=A0A336MSK7_CULSO
MNILIYLPRTNYFYRYIPLRAACIVISVFQILGFNTFVLINYLDKIFKGSFIAPNIDSNSVSNAIYSPVFWYCLLNTILGWILLEGSAKLKPWLIEIFVVTGFVEVFYFFVCFLINAIVNDVNVTLFLGCGFTFYKLICVNSFLQNLNEKLSKNEVKTPSSENV